MQDVKVGCTHLVSLTYFLLLSIQDLTNEYSRTSTIHGFAHFGVYEVSAIARLFWTIAFIVRQSHYILLSTSSVSSIFSHAV